MGTIYYDAAHDEYRRDLIAMVLAPAEGEEAAKVHADAIVLPTVLGPREAAAVKADPAIAGKDVEGGCIIGPGGGDNAMASLGLGMAVGDVSVSLGTSGVAAAIAENPVYDLTGAISGFADCTGHYLPLACTINGSRILDAGRAALGVDYDELAELAFKAEPGAGGITLVPYFDGERTPNRPDAHAEEIKAHPEQKQFYQGIAGVHPESAPFVLDTIRKEYGTTDAYLEAEYGLTPARLMRLRRMYLE